MPSYKIVFMAIKWYNTTNELQSDDAKISHFARVLVYNVPSLLESFHHSHTVMQLDF